MGRDRSREPFEVIAAFEGRDHPAARMTLREVAEPAGDPGEVLRVEHQGGERVPPVGVDARFGPENVRRIDLERLVSQVRSDYDIILVDTGPLLGSLESTPVMAISDGVVLSVRRGRSRTKLEDCVNRLKVVGTECIGVILNCAARSDCNRYVSEASLAAAEEERKGRAASGAVPENRQPGERNILVKAVQNTTRARALPPSGSPAEHSTPEDDRMSD